MQSRVLVTSSLKLFCLEALPIDQQLFGCPFDLWSRHSNSLFSRAEKRDVYMQFDCQYVNAFTPIRQLKHEFAIQGVNLHFFVLSSEVIVV